MWDSLMHHWISFCKIEWSKCPVYSHMWSANLNAICPPWYQLSMLYLSQL